MPRAICLAILIALAGASEVRPQVTSRNKPEEKPTKVCRLPPDDALSLGDVVNAVVEFRGCVVDWVRKRSVKFKATPDIVQLLNDIEAPDGLVALIPLAPSPKVGGPVTVVCEPKDCEVILNERDYGFTQGGKKVISDLAPGRLGVQARRDGSEVLTSTIDLAEGTPQEVKFSLRPNGMARRELGRDRLLAVAAQFGGLTGLFELSDNLVVHGNASVPGDDKKSQEWDMVFQQTWDRLGFHFGTKGAKQIDSCDITVSGAKPVSSECKGKLKGSKLEPALSKTSVLLGKYQVQALLAELLSRDVELAAGSDAAATTIKTVGEAPVDSYEVSLDAKGFPSVVQYRSKPDANPLKIEYSNYSAVEGRQYPLRIKISETSPDKLLVDFTAATAARTPSPGTAGKKATAPK